MATINSEIKIFDISKNLWYKNQKYSKSNCSTVNSASDHHHQHHHHHYHHHQQHEASAAVANTFQVVQSWTWVTT